MNRFKPGGGKRKNRDQRRQKRREEAEARAEERANMTDFERALKDNQTLMKHGSRKQVEYARR
jgi:hypothetical protein